MGTYLFKWTHPATEVYVTGTFDDWGRTVKLNPVGGSFEKLVDLPLTTEKILYKFVVDDNWTTDHTTLTETDEHGNANNVLMPEQIVKKSTGTVGGAAADLPGAFPETPATGTENQTFNVNPIPASAGIGNPVQLRAGEKVPDPSTLTSNTVTSTVTTDKESYEKGVGGAPQLPNPITPESERSGAGLFGLPPITSNLIPESSLPIGTGAATEASRDPGVMIQGGGGAPTTAALAGQVPLEPRGVATTASASDFTGDSAASATAIRSGGGAASTAALAGEVPLEPRGTATTASADAFTGGPDASTAAIRSGGGAPTTAALAGQVPLEPQGVPEIVRDSQAQAGVAPEASANPEALLEKKSVENELSKTVETQPPTSGETSVGDKVAEIAAGAAAGATAAVAAASAYVNHAKDKVQSGEAQDAAKGYAQQAQENASAAKDSAAEYASQAQATAAATAASAKSMLPASVQESIDKMNAAPTLAGAGTGNEPAAPQVPTTVKESISAAGEPAEAAVNPTQVSKKAETERELHESILPAQGTDEVPASAKTASNVPIVASESIAAAHASPEAAADATAVREKTQVENELLTSIHTTQSAGAPAPTVTAATSEIAPSSLTFGKSTEVPLADTLTFGKSTEAPLSVGKSTEAPLGIGKSTETPLTAGKSTLAPLPGSNPTALTPAGVAGAAGGLNASADAPTTTTAALPIRDISRDVSPMTRTDGQTQPIATTGVTSSTVPAVSGTGDVAPGATGASATKTTVAGAANPAVAAAQQASVNPPQVAAAAPGSPASTHTDGSVTSKASKRRSIFGRIKDKMTHKRSDSKGGEGSAS